MTSSKLVIEIGCPPGITRPPDVYKTTFENILEKHNQSDYKNINNFCMEAINNKDNNISFMGEFTWEIQGRLKEDEIEYIERELMKIMEINYQNNVIRYASIKFS